MNIWVFIVLVAWLALFGVKLETQYIKFYVNGVFKTYTMED